jgi:four helix bundle protein
VENIPIIQQLSSSLTSMGANDQETDAAATKKDFLAKYTIVRKETKETKYWLSFVKDTGLITTIIIQPYIEECNEILMIVSKIIENTKYQFH